MKRIIFVTTAILLLLNLSLLGQLVDSTKPASVKNAKFDPARDAKKDIQAAVVMAEKTNRRILLDVGGEWCIWCHRLDSLFIMNSDLRDYLDEHYVIVKVNVSKENENKEVLSEYPEVAGYPHIFVLDKEGTLIHSQNTEELEYPENSPVKGHDKEKVFNFLKKWAD